VMVALCLALAKDLHDDPLMHRDRRSIAAVEQAVDYGTERYGDEFVVAVKPAPDSVNGSEPTDAMPDKPAEKRTDGG
jgi:hypothetical protein